MEPKIIINIILILLAAPRVWAESGRDFCHLWRNH